MVMPLIPATGLCVLLLVVCSPREQWTELSTSTQIKITLDDALAILRIDGIRPGRINPRQAEFGCVSKIFPDQVIELSCRFVSDRLVVHSFMVRKMRKGDFFVPLNSTVRYSLDAS